MKNWAYTLECSDELRSAIREGDAKETLELLKKAYAELFDAEMIDDYDYDNYTEELEFYDPNDDDFMDSVDYELSEFYDLCDNIGVFIEI